MFTPAVTSGPSDRGRLGNGKTKTNISHLYTNYKIDFEMFDYHISDFLKYASS